MAMQIKFWGVRGSIPSPGPDTAFYGGNTSCVDIRFDGHMIILDAGTGLRSLGQRLARTPGPPLKEINLFLSHFHIDHLAGLPFFSPLYQPDVTLNLYGPSGYRRPFEKILSSYFSQEFFPVPIRKIPAKLRYYSLGDEVLKLSPFKIQSFFINHPGRTIAYRVHAGNHSVAYLTDHEPIHEFRHIETKDTDYENTILRKIQGVQILIHDAQFTNEEYVQYRGWGHSPWGYAVRLAEKARARHLVLYHHAPEHKDGFLAGELRDLQKYLNRQKSRLVVSLARERETIRL